MASKTWTEVTIYDNLGNDLGLTALQANRPDPKGPARFMGGDSCFVCGFTYSRDKFVYYKGMAFCIPRGHYKDIEWYRKRDDEARTTEEEES